MLNYSHMLVNIPSICDERVVLQLENSVHDIVGHSALEHEVLNYVYGKVSVYNCHFEYLYDQFNLSCL